MTRGKAWQIGGPCRVCLACRASRRAEKELPSGAEAKDKNMATIAIGQQMGSGGFELAKAAAQRLGARLITVDELFSEAARRYQVEPQRLRVFDEREPHFWDWLTTDTVRLVAYLDAVTVKYLQEDRTVLIGRTLPLFVPYGVSHVLRVRTVAPLALRIHRTIEDEGVSAQQAERLVPQSDREIQARVKSMRQVEVEDPQLYDVVLNTASTPIADLAEVLCDLALAVEKHCAANSHRLLSDACVTSQVRAALIAHPQVGHAPIAVATSDGVVTLRGDSLVPPWDRLVREVVAQVEGVTSVRLETSERPIPPRAG